MTTKTSFVLGLPAPAAGPKPQPAPSASAKATTAATRETAFLRLALDIGLQRAKDLLESAEGKLAAFLATV